MSVNPGFFSFPITGVNGIYNSAFAGTIDIDWIGIGDNCTPPVSLEFRESENNISSNTLNESIYIAPNPFQTSSTIRLNHLDNIAFGLRIMDTKGICWYNTTNHHSNETIEIGKELPSGIYTLILNYSDTVQTIKILKIE